MIPSITFYFEPDYTFVLPTVVISRGECPNPNCQEKHGVMFELVWLNFTLSLGFGGINAPEE